jgi:hypothetical protein
VPHQDTGLFARLPSDPLLGGRASAPSRFPGGFVLSVGRTSNHCHSVAAFAADPDGRGARFLLKKHRGCYSKEKVWVPPPGCARGGAGAPAPDTLLDAVTTDIWEDPSQCPCPHSLTPASLLAAVQARPKLTHLFVLGMADPDGLAAALEAAGDQLEVVCLAECQVSARSLRALAASGPRLRAVSLHSCKAPDGGGDADDEAWAALLAASPGLLWMSVSFNGVRDGAGFGARAWAALPACQALRVLALELSFSGNAFGGGAGPGCLAALGGAMEAALRRLPALQMVSILPDNKNGKSRVTINPVKVGKW